MLLMAPCAFASLLHTSRLIHRRYHTAGPCRILQSGKRYTREKRIELMNSHDGKRVIVWQCVHPLHRVGTVKENIASNPECSRE